MELLTGRSTVADELPPSQDALVRCIQNLDVTAQWPACVAAELASLALCCAHRTHLHHRPRFIEVVRTLRSVKQAGNQLPPSWTRRQAPQPQRPTSCSAQINEASRHPSSPRRITSVTPRQREASVPRSSPLGHGGNIASVHASFSPPQSPVARVHMATSRTQQQQLQQQQQQQQQQQHHHMQQQQLLQQ